MPRKRDDKAKPAPSRREAAAAAGSDRFAQYDGWLLAAVTCLLVVTPLVPSEATVHEGTAAPLNLLWLLALFAWTALLALRPDPQIKFGWTGVAAGALVGWHTLSALTIGLSGNGRQSLNMLWQMISYAIAAFLLRQLLRTPAQCRTLVVVMIALAALESTQGFYEYFLSKPAAVAEFQLNPEKAYQELGATTPTQREHLRWRIESVEPLVTFALANSLAGLLAPWLVAVLAIAVSLVDSRRGWRAICGAIAVAAVIGGCLLLTKSRTAVLAVGVGVVLVALYGRSGGWRIGWKLPLGAALGAVVIGLGAIAVGGLDVQVLSEAPTSVLYRLQYWRATAGLIADHPLLGCGPGQFQEAYAQYKLPEASEMPRDPHNFLLEIWATAGTPAVAALLAIAVALAWQLSTATQTAVQAEEQRQFQWRLLAGGLAGVLLAYPLGLIVGYPPELVALGENIQMPGIWLWGLPAAALCVWLLDDWARDGKLPASLPPIVLLVLAVNLLAAGATSFPGVFLWAWLLIPLALANVRAAGWTWSPGKPAALGLLGLSLLLAVLCVRTEVSPVLVAPGQMDAANRLLSSGRVATAENELLAATQADRWSPQPWQMLAEARLHVWSHTRQDRDWQRFEEAAQAYRSRDPRHHAQFAIRGNWLLLAWRHSGDPQQLAAAIDAYRAATVWYPAGALGHAQLAWALHLAGRENEAIAAANEALRLDSLTPHRELKLSGQTIYDPPAGPATGSAELPNAEQRMQQLRTSIGPEISP